MKENNSEEVFHYTTNAGLLGILDSQCLWATHYKFLNDTSELSLFKDKLVSFLLEKALDDDDYVDGVLKSLEGYHDLPSDPFLKEQVAHNNLVSKVKYLVEYLSTDLPNLLKLEVYLASFSIVNRKDYEYENGLLSQWRGYSQDGGYAIVFDKRKLVNLIDIEVKQEKETIIPIFGNVLYSNEDFKEFFSEQLSIIYDFLIKFDDKDKKIKPGNVFKAFTECSILYKHQGFLEENEFRIGIILTGSSEKERKFRSQAGNNRPYIELFKILGKALPINRIIVGPHRHSDTCAEELRIRLRKTNISISISETPFIS